MAMLGYAQHDRYNECMLDHHQDHENAQITTDATDMPRRPVTGDSDEVLDFNIGSLDWIFGLLTFPLLFGVLMYAVTGGQSLYATRSARYRLYAVLFGIEMVIVAMLVWWVIS